MLGHALLLPHGYDKGLLLLGEADTFSQVLQAETFTMQCCTLWPALMLGVRWHLGGWKRPQALQEPEEPGENAE